MNLRVVTRDATERAQLLLGGFFRYLLPVLVVLDLYAAVRPQHGERSRLSADWDDVRGPANRLVGD